MSKLADDLVLRLDREREALASRGAMAFDSDTLDRLRESLQAGPAHPVIDAFLDDLRNACVDGPDFRRTRDAVTAHDDKGLILGFFSAAYNPQLGLDAVSFDLLSAHRILRDRYPNDGIRAISLRQATRGFRFQLSVAMFPENFLTKEPVMPRHRAYYFIDRFVRRHQQITRAILAAGTAPEAFAKIKRATEAQIKRACVTWVHLHEYFHRLGYLPLPENLGVKSSRSTAGLEEVRCDALACLTAYKEVSNGFEEGELHAELILAERLLRYPLQDEPQLNYDSRGSQFLFGFLQNRGAIGEDGKGRIEFPSGMEGVTAALREMVVGVNKLEHAECEEPDAPIIKRKRMALVRHFGGFDRARNEFNVLPFYRNVRRVLIADGVNVNMDY